MLYLSRASLVGEAGLCAAWAEPTKTPNRVTMTGLSYEDLIHCLIPTEIDISTCRS